MINKFRKRKEKVYILDLDEIILKETLFLSLYKRKMRVKSKINEKK